MVVVSFEQPCPDLINLLLSFFFSPMVVGSSKTDVMVLVHTLGQMAQLSQEHFTWTGRKAMVFKSLQMEILLR